MIRRSRLKGFGPTSNKTSYFLNTFFVNCAGICKPFFLLRNKRPSYVLVLFFSLQEINYYFVALMSGCLILFKTIILISLYESNILDKPQIFNEPNFLELCQRYTWWLHRCLGPIWSSLEVSRRSEAACLEWSAPARPGRTPPWHWWGRWRSLSETGSFAALRGWKCRKSVQNNIS